MTAENPALIDLLLENRHFSDINPLLCGSERCAPGHAFGPASRSCHLLHYVASGRGTFSSPRGEWSVRAGQLFVIRPREITFYRADSLRPWHYIWVGFESALPLPAALEADVADAPQCGRIFSSLLEAGEFAGGRELYLCGRIFELFAALSDASPAAGDRGSGYVRRARNFIEQNYLNPISVESIARELSLDRSYFCRVFKRQVGQSPQQYLVGLRLEKAAELIAACGYSPSQAARSSGYRDSVNFSRMFKRRYGVPPSAYGKNNAEKAF